MRGVPDELRPRLAEWTQTTLETFDDGTARLFALKMGVPVGVEASKYHTVERFKERMLTDELFTWDVVDALLEVSGDWFGLRQVLDLVDHELTIAETGRSLEYRTPKETEAAYLEVVSESDHASALLRSAWARTFSRERDPKTAWEDAKSAVENLLRPVVSPDDANATISKMARALRDKPSKWVSHLRTANMDDPVLAFAKALEMVWYPPARHGEDEGVDPLMSRAAVLQAVTICQWLRDGVLEPS